MIPFDLSKAKTPENPSGLEVVTNYNKSVRIVSTDRCSGSGYSIVGLVAITEYEEYVISYKENGVAFTEDGKCLLLKEPITQRKMTQQELAWWLMEHPEEHREYMFFEEGDIDKERKCVHHDYDYHACDKDIPVQGIVIRSNGGEWREPLIVEDYEL